MTATPALALEWITLVWLGAVLSAVLLSAGVLLLRR